jgi:hypothetical protein
MPALLSTKPVGAEGGLLVCYAGQCQASEIGLSKLFLSRSIGPPRVGWIQVGSGKADKLGWH